MFHKILVKIQLVTAEIYNTFQGMTIVTRANVAWTNVLERVVTCLIFDEHLIMYNWDIGLFELTRRVVGSGCFWPKIMPLCGSIWLFSALLRIQDGAECGNISLTFWMSGWGEELVGSFLCLYLITCFRAFWTFLFLAICLVGKN